MASVSELYLAFLRIGAVNFGGGYAMLPLLQQDLVDKRDWTTSEELMDYFAIGQCTPGIIALNVSTFIGYKQRGVAGALATTAGFLTVPIFLILVIAMFLQNFAELAVVQHAFAGIRVCVCVLIINSVLRLWKKAIVNRLALGLYLAILLLMLFSAFLPFKIPTVLFVVSAAIFGLIFAREEAAS